MNSQKTTIIRVCIKYPGSYRGTKSNDQSKSYTFSILLKYGVFAKFSYSKSWKFYFSTQFQLQSKTENYRGDVLKAQKRYLMIINHLKPCYFPGKGFRSLDTTFTVRRPYVGNYAYWYVSSSTENRELWWWQCFVIVGTGGCLIFLFCFTYLQYIEFMRNSAEYYISSSGEECWNYIRKFSH